MSLVEGNELFEVSEADFIDVGAAIEKWQHFPASTILHHGKPCCSIAREWIFSTDYILLNGEHPLTGPRWIRQKYTWGPSRWPLSWCEAVKQKTLDCGALAAISHEVFTARGVKSYPAQFIQQYSEDSARHWQRKWDGEEASTHWIKEDLIYHEGCAVVVRDNEIKIWDSSAGWWVNPKQFGGYGGVLVLRVCASQIDSPTDFIWGGQRIAANQWQKIEKVRNNFSTVSAS
jgi:pimeloyl-ACP methyl ester carboxylesterase